MCTFKVALLHFFSMIHSLIINSLIFIFYICVFVHFQFLYFIDISVKYAFWQIFYINVELPISNEGTEELSVDEVDYRGATPLKVLMNDDSNFEYYYGCRF